MNPILIRQLMNVGASRPRGVPTSAKPLTAHAVDIATNFLNEVWRTHTAQPSINVTALLEQQTYCLDAALRLCRVGRGDVDSTDAALQQQLAKVAVGAVAQSWKLHSNASKLKHVMRGVQSNLKALKLDENLCPPMNPPVPMQEEHPYLCPPVQVGGTLPGLSLETPQITGRGEPEIFDETTEANEMAYAEAMKSQGEDAYEQAFWKNTRELEDVVQGKKPSKPKKSAKPEKKMPEKSLKAVELEPITPSLEEKLQVLTPIARPAAPAAPSCNISLAWLKEFSADKSVDLRDNSTFLAFPDSHLVDFDNWAKQKKPAEIRTVKLGMIKARLSHENQRGMRRFNLATLSNVTHRIEDGAVVSGAKRSQIFPSERQINGKKVLVLASEHPFE